MQNYFKKNYLFISDCESFELWKDFMRLIGLKLFIDILDILASCSTKSLKYGCDKACFAESLSSGLYAKSLVIKSTHS